MMTNLSKKVKDALRIVDMADSAARHIGEDALTLAYSTGKDSDIVLRLARMAGARFRAIYHATGLDPSGSIRHAMENGAKTVMPETPFFKLMETYGFPTRRARWCCKELKEKYDSPISLLGIRASESTARAARYKEPTTCRLYGGHLHTEFFMPILGWTDDDVVEFVESEGLRCHPHYYDLEGNFHVERRVGCLCCPMMSNNKLIRSFKDNPAMAKAYIRHGKVWWDTHPNAKSREKFGTVYDLFLHNVFCRTFPEYETMKRDMGIGDARQYLMDFFGTELP